MKLFILAAATFFAATAAVNADPTWVSESTEEGVIEEIGTEEVRTKKTADAQSIYIVNENKSGNDVKSQNEVAAESQQVTLVEASPINQSKASNLRAVRKNAEIETEQKIVEKLEASRLDDERQRAARLFSDSKFKRADVQEEAAVATQIGAKEQAPIQIIQVEKIVEVEKAASQVVVQKEVVAEKVATPVAPQAAPVVVNEVSYESESHVGARESLFSEAYVGLGIGSVDYKASNVESKYAWNLGVGMNVNPNVTVEASFMYSQHRVDEIYNDFSYLGSYGLTDLDQYNFGLEARYNLTGHHIFKPYVGVYAGMTKRNYYGVNTGYDDFNYAGNESEASTRSFNLAPVIGVDFQVNRSFTVGLDYRYMMNLAQKYSSDDLKYSVGYVDATPLEEINYSVLSLKGKFNF